MNADVSQLRSIKTFPQLVKYLRDELDWPIKTEDFEELTFDYAAEELGLDAATAVKIKDIRQLRPLTSKQPWGVFFVSFEPRRLPVVALRRILSNLVLKKRSSANKAQQAAWSLNDLLFISSYGESDHREITFAHFSDDSGHGDLPTLRVLGWDDENTALHLEHTHKELKEKLTWPDDQKDVTAWREKWSSAFTLRHRQVITTSKALAERLADLARSIRKRANAVLKLESDKGPLRKLHAAFKEALIHDLSEDDFADMYAQTISYGLLTARVSRPAGLVAENLSNMIPVTNPFVKELLETFLTVGGRKGEIDFDELGVSEVVQLLRDADMEAVLRDFGDRNRQEDPVIHFYELFLKEYDAKKRMQRGVFYTPRPVVSFIVRSVHEILQTEFHLEDGLADTTTWNEMLTRHKDLQPPGGTSLDEPFVQILDPATGTATFLVEVIQVIYNTLTAKWKQQHLTVAQQRVAWNHYVPKHLLPRLYGYELMMAPYAIAHMKIGLKLCETGYLFDSDQRVNVYLTNTLESANDEKKQMTFAEWAPAVAHEAQAVGNIKRHQRFTAVVGNPPYSHRANLLLPEQRAIIEPYKFIQGRRMKVRGALQLERNLNDDYVKFIRFGQMLVEKIGVGLVGMITNNAYLENVTFPGMRSSLGDTFNWIRLVNLHGSTKAGDIAPDGEKDENVFDIQQGVSISLLAKTPGDATNRQYCDVWGTRSTKERLLHQGDSPLLYRSFKPEPESFLFVPSGGKSATDYLKWKPLDKIFEVFGTGVMTNRNSLTIGMTADELARTIQVFTDTHLDDQTVSERIGIKSNALWNLHAARGVIRQLTPAESFRPIDYRPFDTRVIFYHSAAVDNMRRGLMEAILRPGNFALVVSRQQFRQGFQHVHITHRVFDECLLSTASREKASGFPLLCSSDPSDRQLALPHEHSNIDPGFVAVLGGKRRLSVGRAQFNYIYAILHSPNYRSHYAEQLKRGYPRIPETDHVSLAEALTQYGSELIALHLLELGRAT